MCFGGGGGGGTAVAPINFTQPISKQIDAPEPVVRTFKPLIDEGSTAAVRLGTTKKRKTPTATPLRQSLSSGISMASNGGSYPTGGINL